MTFEVMNKWLAKYEESSLVKDSLVSKLKLLQKEILKMMRNHHTLNMKKPDAIEVEKAGTRESIDLQTGGTII